MARFIAREIIPILVAIGLENVDGANQTIKILEKGADRFEKEWKEMIAVGPSVNMTRDEYEKWFGDG